MFRVCKTGSDLVGWELVVESTVKQELQVNEKRGHSRLRYLWCLRRRRRLYRSGPRRHSRRRRPRCLRGFGKRTTLSQLFSGSITITELRRQLTRLRSLGDRQCCGEEEGERCFGPVGAGCLWETVWNP